MSPSVRPPRLLDEQGYLMVALLVAMSIMGIMMAAALPTYHTMAQREKEAELVFRGEQIARAIGLYQRRVANAAVPSIDFLVEQKYLRKKYKDPITNDDFEPLTSGAGGALGAVQGAQTALQQAQGRAGGAAAQGRGGAAAQGRGGAVAGGIVGVTSKSPLKSLRLYNDRDTYNQWVFMPVARGRVGGDAGGAGADGRGGRGADGRGGRGADGRGGRGADGRGGDGRGGRGADGRGGRGADGGGGRGGLEQLFQRGRGDGPVQAPGR